MADGLPNFQWTSLVVRPESRKFGGPR